MIFIWRSRSSNPPTPILKATLAACFSVPQELLFVRHVCPRTERNDSVLLSDATLNNGVQHRTSCLCRSLSYIWPAVPAAFVKRNTPMATVIIIIWSWHLLPGNTNTGGQCLPKQLCRIDLLQLTRKAVLSAGVCAVVFKHRFRFVFFLASGRFAKIGSGAIWVFKDLQLLRKKRLSR